MFTVNGILLYVVIFSVLGWRFHSAYSVPIQVLKNEVTKEALYCIWIQAIVFLIVPFIVIFPPKNNLDTGTVTIVTIFYVLSLYTFINLFLYYKNMRKEENADYKSECSDDG